MRMAGCVRMLKCYLTVVVYVVLFPPCHGFIPTKLHGMAGLTPSSRTHEDIIDIAIVRLARTLMDRYPLQYSNPSETLNSGSYKQARKQFLAAVAYPDMKEAENPAAHFDNETFAAGVERLASFRQTVIASIQSGEMENARQFAGRALHGLQDFYSHSNWVEMGNNGPYPRLGLEAIPETSLAEPTEATCENCIEHDGDESTMGRCYNNVLTNVNNQRLLTSGFYKSKLPGKCSHGGLVDMSRNKPPLGGINKDSERSVWSPHNYLHHKAASIAFQSTIEFLESIRVAVVKDSVSAVMPDEDFAEFLGISVGSATTLCFIVDTTGSMSAEITAVRDVTIRITQSASNSTGSMKPSDYVLSPYNDPGYGPLFKTTSATAMIQALSQLRAKGGRDEPELAFHGIQSALENVRVGSTCHMFTDASAKDEYLFPVVLSLALKKKVKISLFYTRSKASQSLQTLQQDDHQQQQQQAGPTSRRRHKRATHSYYDDLCKQSGGTALTISKQYSDIQQAVSVISNGPTAFTVNVLTADDTVSGFTFYVDNTMTDVIVELSDSDSSLTGITFLSPSGVVYSDYTVLLNLTSLHQYNMSQLQPGLWKANVSTTRPFSVVITAKSPVSFTYQISTQGDGPHPGYMAITGNPIVGTPYHVVVDVFGAVDAATNEPYNILSNITAILLVDQTGQIISKLNTNELIKLRQFEAETVLPSTGFRVVVEGTDTSGHVVRRFDQSVMSAVVVKLDVKLPANSSVSLLAGQSVNVSVNVTSISSTTTTWYLRVSDTANFYTAAASIPVILDTNESQVIDLKFQAPPTAKHGTVSTVTISAGTSSQSSVINYEILYLNVKPTFVDSNGPSCVVDRVEGVCSGDRPLTESQQCLASTWSVHFHVQDTGIGLKSVSVKPLMRNYQFNLVVDPFNTPSTAVVSGTYSTSCCYQNVTLDALDVYGNLGSCVVYNDPVSPTCVVVHNEGGCKSSYSSNPSCQSDSWQATVNVYDAGSGLKHLTTSSLSADVTLDQTAVEYGSVTLTNVTFKSTCCHLSSVNYCHCL